MPVFNSLNVFLLIYIVDGEGQLIYEDGVIQLTKGSSIMVPANMGEYTIQGKIEAIVTYINRDLNNQLGVLKR